MGAVLGATLGALPAGAAEPAPVPAGAAPTDTASAAAPRTARRLLDRALAPDRLAHASFALAIGAGVGLASREPAAGAAGALSLAVAKELLDDRFDRGDLVAGAVGAALAWGIVAALTR